MTSAIQRFAYLIRQCVAGARAGADLRSRCTLALDPLVERLSRRRALAPDRLRTVKVREFSIAYRANAGDIQSVREVLIDEIYRFPAPIDPRTVVDLGANIGLTSLYFSRRYRPECIVAVEPDPSNALLARRNLSMEHVQVIEAAVTSSGKQVRFATSCESNLGKVSDDGNLLVQGICMEDIVRRSPSDRIDLLKIDIEGGEQELFSADCGWLDCVGAIIAEFHPDSVDVQAVVAKIVERGFRYLPAGSAWTGSMDAFIRT